MRIFPSPEAAHAACKLPGRWGGAFTIGPIPLGTGPLVNLLRTGDDVEDIVVLATVAMMDAHNR